MPVFLRLKLKLGSALLALCGLAFAAGTQAQPFAPLTSYNNLRLAMELELREEGLRGLLPFFRFDDPELEKKSVEEKAKFVMQDVLQAYQREPGNENASQILKQMRLRSDIDPQVKNTLEKFEWVMGGTCVEFRHKDVDTDPAAFWKDLLLLTEKSGVDQKFLRPMEPITGPWFTVHLNLTLKNQDSIPAATARGLNLLMLQDFIARGRGASALSNQTIVSFLPAKSKGLMSIAKGRYELRAYSQNPKEELERAVHYLGLPQDIAAQKLAEEVFEKTDFDKMRVLLAQNTDKAPMVWSEFLSLMSWKPELIRKLHDKAGSDFFRVMVGSTLKQWGYGQYLEEYARLRGALDRSGLVSPAGEYLRDQLNQRIDHLMKASGNALMLSPQSARDTLASPLAFEALDHHHQVLVTKEVLKGHHPEATRSLEDTVLRSETFFQKLSPEDRGEITNLFSKWVTDFNGPYQVGQGLVSIRDHLDDPRISRYLTPELTEAVKPATPVLNHPIGFGGVCNVFGQPH